MVNNFEMGRVRRKFESINIKQEMKTQQYLAYLCTWKEWARDDYQAVTMLET